MDEVDYLKEQARQCRTAALRAEARAERQGLMQLARYYDGEAQRAHGGTARPAARTAIGFGR